MLHGSLFSGIGGFDLGFDRAGFSTTWQVENDRFCNAVLATHWPHVERFSDIRLVGRNCLAPVDVITAGVPCQDWSVAGKRAGISGERSGLFFEFARILRELQPSWFVFENVPGLLSANSGRDFAVILSALGEIGYGLAWRVLDSRFFGVAQRRRRVFIVGSLGAMRAAEVLFESEGGKGHPAKGGEAGKDVAYALAASVSGVGGHGQMWNSNYVARAIATGSVGSGYRYDPNGEEYVVPGVVSAATNPDRMRDFTGLPEGLDSPRYRALGNAVTVRVAEWIARRISGFH